MSTRSKLAVAGLLATLLAAVAVAASVLAVSPAHETQVLEPHAASDPAHTAPAGVRTLVLRRGRREPPPSRLGRAMHGLLLEGKAPAGAAMATVTSDEDCAPDAKGISHCLNRLRLDGGHRLAVRHPHDMHQVPCMTPGERVRVIPS